MKKAFSLHVKRALVSPATTVVVVSHSKLASNIHQVLNGCCVKGNDWQAVAKSRPFVIRVDSKNEKVLPTTVASADLEAVSKSSAVTSHLNLPAVAHCADFKWTTWGEDRVIWKENTISQKPCFSWVRATVKTHTIVWEKYIRFFWCIEKFWGKKSLLLAVIQALVLSPRKSRISKESF